MKKRQDAGSPAGMRVLCLEALRFESEQRNKSFQVRTCKVGVRERPGLTGAGNDPDGGGGKP